METNEKLLKTVKYIDYCWVNNYIKNILITVNNLHDINNWKIFSNYSTDEKHNILYLVQALHSQNVFKYKIFLLSVHIYKNICVRYAHIIDNYVCLLGSIYIAVNRSYCDEYLTEHFLVKILKIELCIVKEMISCIENFLVQYKIYFTLEEKKKIKNEIKNEIYI